MPQRLKAISIIINDLTTKKKYKEYNPKSKFRKKYVSPSKEKGNVIYFPFYQRKLCAGYLELYNYDFWF